MAVPSGSHHEWRILQRAVDSKAVKPKERLLNLTIVFVQATFAFGLRFATKRDFDSDSRICRWC